MKLDQKFLAIIPARNGSKGLPGKNIVELCGKPLIAWSIDAALRSKYISKVIVSSDSDHILNIAVSYGSSVIKRPIELASDKSPTEPVIMHAILSLLELNENYEYIVLLQPTSPLRTTEDIDQAICMMRNKNANALISVYEPEHTPYKALKENSSGFIEGLIDNETPFKRRQDLPKVYMPNGAIYIIKTDIFIGSGRLLTDHTIPFQMSMDKSLDIDNLEDLNKAKKLLAN